MDDGNVNDICVGLAVIGVIGIVIVTVLVGCYFCLAQGGMF